MIICRASPAHSLEISQLIPQAAKLTELLYTDLILGKSVAESLQLDVEQEGTKCSYGNCLIAREGDQILGVANFYPSEEHILTNEMVKKFGKEKIAYIEPIFKTPLPLSLYIAALFVAESARGKGVGKKLIHAVRNRANALKRSGLTLHCWVENHPAMEFYKKLHFVRVETLDLGPHKLLPYDGRLTLLKSS